MIELRGKRIAVTGGDGFLGSHVVSALTNRGCSEIFIPRTSEYNLTLTRDIERFYEDARPEVLFHLAAAVGGIGANCDNPGRFFYENAVMGIQLIEYARRNRVEKTVVVGTICCYPKDAPVPFREESLWNGYPDETTAPYGIAKKALLVQCQSYRRQYGLNSVFLMPVNLYGPGDNFDASSSHVIAALVRRFVEARASRAEAVVCWGDGTATREFLYVDDAAEGLILAAERFDGCDAVNLGTGQETPIRELAGMIAKLVGYEGQIVWDSSKPNGQPRRCLDVSRAERCFGFRARTRLEDGLAKTVEWFLTSSRLGAKSPSPR